MTLSPRNKDNSGRVKGTKARARRPTATCAYGKIVNTLFPIKRVMSPAIAKIAEMRIGTAKFFRRILIKI